MQTIWCWILQEHNELSCGNIGCPVETFVARPSVQPALISMVMSRQTSTGPIHFEIGAHDTWTASFRTCRSLATGSASMLLINKAMCALVC